MPAYTWLVDEFVDMDELGSKLGALQMLNVPYDNATIANPEAAYDKQTQEIVEGLAAEGINVSNRSEMVAMIAYLQKLGRDLKSVSKEEMQELKKSN